MVFPQVILCFSFPAALQSDGQEVASVVSAQEIRVVAELLQISPEGLQKAVTHKVTVSFKPSICMRTNVLAGFPHSVLESNKPDSAVCDNPGFGAHFLYCYLQL